MKIQRKQWRPRGLPLPKNKRHRDRKNDYSRKQKYKDKIP